MYDQIVKIYDQIFPINKVFLQFLYAYLEKKSLSILDIGCGPGDYVDHLVKHGHQAVGIDNSKEMIHYANEHNQGSFHTLGFQQIGQLKQDFDLIYSIGNSLSYLGKAEESSFFNTLYKKLLPCGAFIMQTVNWDRYKVQQGINLPEKKLNDEMTFLRAYEPQSDGTVLFKTALQKSGITTQKWEAILTPRSSQEILSTLHKAGFAAVELFGDFKRAHFDPKSSPALIISTKKKQR